MEWNDGVAVFCFGFWLSLSLSPHLLSIPRHPHLESQGRIPPLLDLKDVVRFFREYYYSATKSPTCEVVYTTTTNDENERDFERMRIRCRFAHLVA